MIEDSDKNWIRQAVMEEMAYCGQVSEEQLDSAIHQKINSAGNGAYMRLGEKRKLSRDIFNSIRKMDVLQDLLEDEAITEIMVNGHENIFIEKEGVLQNTGLRFSSLQKLEEIAGQIAAKGNRIVNETNPILDVRLEDGSRVNIVLPPVALEGPVITIRKFPKRALTMEKLLQFGAITKEAAGALEQLVLAKYNIFISGGTGAGKTTFLNILSDFIPKNERVITIEDSAELQIHGIDNLVRLESRNSNVEGKNQITIRDLMKSALRMRPDRVIVGEIRDAAAIDMLTAMNTGHDGSLSTGHANSPADMLARLETLVLMGMDIPLAAIQQQVSSAIDIVVHVGRCPDGSRKVQQIVEVGSIVDGKIKIRSLFEYKEGKLRKTGKAIENREKLLRAGVETGEL